MRNHHQPESARTIFAHHSSSRGPFPLSLWVVIISYIPTKLGKERAWRDGKLSVRGLTKVSADSLEYSPSQLQVLPSVLSVVWPTFSLSFSFLALFVTSSGNREAVQKELLFLLPGKVREVVDYRLEDSLNMCFECCFGVRDPETWETGLFRSGEQRLVIESDADRLRKKKRWGIHNKWSRLCIHRQNILCMST